MRSKGYRRNPILSLPRVGPSEAAGVFGWKSPLSFKRHISDLPTIRTVRLRKGMYYILEDVLRARYPDADDKQIKTMATEFRYRKTKSRHNKRAGELVGPSEASKIFGWRSPLTFKKHLKDLPVIKSVKLPRGRFYEMADVFKAMYPEANQWQLNEMIIEYKRERVAKNLAKSKGGVKNEHFQTK